MFRKTKILFPVLLVLSLGACSGEPEWVVVYEQCKETVQTESAKIKAAGADSSDEQSRAMAESMGNVAMNMAMNGCEMIRTSCEQDADGPTCRAYIEQGKQH